MALLGVANTGRVANQRVNIMPNTQTATKTKTAPAVALAPVAPVTQATMLTLAHAAHGHGGKTIAGYHAGNTKCIGTGKGAVPVVAANLVCAYFAQNPGATVTPTGVANTVYGIKKPGGLRHTIQAAIMAGGSVKKLAAVSKANGATYGGLADLVAMVWLGLVTIK
jgi:hypothetical protein|tara:strand:+ start:91 stop:588 length:498 start_codon:yes stop_codon:yes gene_type:complete